MWKRKFRYIFLGAVYKLLEYYEISTKTFTSRYHRSLNKYKKRWVTRYNPSAVTYLTAQETTWQSELLSKQVSDRFSEMFVRLDAELKFGVSRQLVLDVLERMEIIVDQQKKLDFLNESGYESMRQKMLKSMSLKQFLTTMERYAIKEGKEDSNFI